MATKITSVYNAVINSMENLFPNKTRIFDSRNIENNPTPFLKDGWGIRYEGANLAEGEFCNIHLEHEFTAILTKEFTNMGDQTSVFDVTMKDLLEDAYLIQNKFYAFDQLDIPDNIETTNIRTTSGILSALEDKENFVYMEINFTIEIKENL